MNRRRFDATSLIGLPLGLALAFAAHVLEGGSLRSLLQGTAALVVFGGTLGAVLLGFSASEVRRAARSLKSVFVAPPVEDPEVTVGRLVRYALRARRLGIMALDRDLAELDDAAVPDPFLEKALGLAVDGASARSLREILELDCLAREEEDEGPSRVFEAAGGYAPTFGILGAVLGLIHVMSNLSEPSRLGAGIAVAFVATVYGVGSANLILLPVAAKLRGRARREARRRELVLEGILAIQEGLNPRLIHERLRSAAGLPMSRPVASSLAAPPRRYVDPDSVDTGAIARSAV